MKVGLGNICSLSSQFYYPYEDHKYWMYIDLIIKILKHHVLEGYQYH